MSIYCMRVGSCADKPGYLEKAKSGKSTLSTLACVVTFGTFTICLLTMHERPGIVFKVNRGQQEARLTDIV